MYIRDFKKLADFLESHETDIAEEINDFGELKYLFVNIFGQLPNKEGTHNLKDKI